MENTENITTKFKVDISDLKASITEANKQMKLANAEFKAAAAGMDDWEKSADGITAKLKQLDSVLAAQKSKLQAYQEQLARIEAAEQENGKRADELRAKLKELADSGISKTSAEYKEYEKALNDCEKEQAQNKKAADDLRVTILNQQAAVNGTEKEIRQYNSQLNNLANESDEAEKETRELGDSFDKTKGKAGELAKKLTKALVAGIVAVGAAAVATGKKAIEAYADYEQFAGGIETLFGDSADAVKQYANNAYKTAGLSANQYMEMVTSFSASLLQSLDGNTKKAASYADRAITDMSDNANKMGTDISSLQNAYQGFAKANYTMLDNLKLGYGGTKSEMLRLIKDAAAMTDVQEQLGITVDANSLSFDNVVNAISVMQTSMGIAGTTAKEANETISGSLNSMKSAWKNLLVGLAKGDSDFDFLMSNFTDSALTFAKNVFPKIQSVISGLVRLVSTTVAQTVPNLIKMLIQEAIPIFTEVIPSLLPVIVKALIDLITVLVQNLNAILQPLLSMLPEILTMIFTVFVPELIRQLGTLLPIIISSILEALPMIIDVLISDALPEILIAIIEVIPQAIVSIAQAIATNFIPIVKAIFQGLGKIASKLWSWLKENFGKTITNFFSGMWDAIKIGAVDAWEGIKSVFGKVSDWFGSVFQKAWGKVKDVFAVGGKIFDGIKDGIVNAFKAVVNAIIGGLNKAIAFPFNKINDILNGIRNINILGVKPFEGLWKQNPLPVPQIPKLARGGVLRRGQLGILEGSGAEAVVPLERNKHWIKAVAVDMLDQLQAASGASNTSNAINNSRVNNFTQIINAPKQPSRIELYRQTRNLLAYAGKTGGM